MSLRNLPVTPGADGEDGRVKEAYTSELKAVTSPEQLWEFAKRWRPLYLMTRKKKIDKKAKDAKRFRISQNNMQALINGTWDPRVAFQCIQEGRTGICKHARMYACPGSHILAPLILMYASFIAKEYGVSTDIALIQLGGGMGKLECP